ncbi:MAG: hypothetical protein AB1644_09480 [Candidatus Zixiibacteriota bacterium]
MTPRFTTACLVFASMVASNMTARAQSEFIYDGSDGIGIFGGYGFNEDLRGPSVNAGFSSKGKFDLGMNIGYITGDNVSVKVLGVGANVLVVKEDTEVPFTLALTGRAEVDVFSVDEYWSKRQFDIQLATLGVWGYKRIVLSRTTFLLPSIGLMKVSSIDDEIDGYTVASGAFQIAFGNPVKKLWVIGVTISRAEERTTGYVGVGQVLMRE